MARKVAQPAAVAAPKAQPKTKAIEKKPKNPKARFDISKL
jgi:hypothetical protein